MAAASKTWVVECYVPGVDDAGLRQAADHAAAEVRRHMAGASIEYLGALLMATDEVVLHTFRATDAELVAHVAATAGLAFDRVVESVEVHPSRSLPSGHNQTTTEPGDAPPQLLGPDSPASTPGRDR